MKQNIKVVLDVVVFFLGGKTKSMKRRRVNYVVRDAGEHQHQRCHYVFTLLRKLKTRGWWRACCHSDAIHVTLISGCFISRWPLLSCRSTCSLKFPIVRYMTLSIAYSATIGPDPEFVEPLQNLTVTAGRDVRLQCSVKHLGSYKVNAVIFHLSNCIISNRNNNTGSLDLYGEICHFDGAESRHYPQSAD